MTEQHIQEVRRLTAENEKLKMEIEKLKKHKKDFKESIQTEKVKKK